MRKKALAVLLFGAATLLVGGTAFAQQKVNLSLLIDNQTALDGIKGVIAAAEKALNISVTIDLRPGGAEGDNVVPHASCHGRHG